MSDTYELSVPAEVHHCPLCGEPMWAGGEIEIDGEPDFDEIARAVATEIALRTEEAIIDHYRARHGVRYWLWRKIGWRRVLGV